MSEIDRRTFLRGAAAATASAGALLAVPAPVRAFSQLLAPGAVQAIPGGPYKILEIICPGGVCQWENFWVRPTLAQTNGWFDFGSLEWTCAGSPMPDATMPFGQDGLGTEIEWGPATAPLWTPDIIDRTRMVTVCHEFDPHEVALSHAITGVGAIPSRAGLGAAIQAHNLALEPRSLPYSYVLSPQDPPVSYALSYAASTGNHGATSRPLQIKLGSTALKEQLLRNAVTPNSNALLDYYRNAFRERMRFQGSGAPVRAPGYEAFEAAADALNVAPQLDSFLTASLLEVGTGEICVQTPLSGPTLDQYPNSTRSQLRLAAHLLEEADARHAFVLDRGIVQAPGGNGAPYDTHNNWTSEVTATNLFNLCREIRELVDATSGPRINLDDTLVVIQTEYSRDPVLGSGGVSAGTEHHYDGFVSVLIGGPITERGIAGGLDEDSACGVECQYSPTDVQGALRIAAGVPPIGGANFSIGQLSDDIMVDGNESATIANLENIILGL